MKRRLKRYYANGKMLSPPVSLDYGTLSRLVVDHYRRRDGGRCDCGATENLVLARRDGFPRTHTIYGLAEIINHGLPGSYTLRCRRCVAKAGADWRKKRERILSKGRKAARRAAREAAEDAATAVPAKEAEEAKSPGGEPVAQKSKPPSVRKLATATQDPDMLQFFTECPKAAATIQERYGDIVEAMRVYAADGGWIVMVRDGSRLRVPAARAA